MKYRAPDMIDEYDCATWLNGNQKLTLDLLDVPEKEMRTIVDLWLRMQEARGRQLGAMPVPVVLPLTVASPVTAVLYGLAVCGVGLLAWVATSW